MRNMGAEVQVLLILAIVQAAGVLFSLQVNTSTAEGVGDGGAGSSILLFVLILAATAIMLALIRWGLSSYLYAFSLYGGVFTVSWFLSMLSTGRSRLSLVVGAVAIAAAALGKRGLARTIVSLVLAIGISVMMGIFFGPMALIGLMLLLSAYDYIAVRKTRHMVQLAEDVIEKRGPQMIHLGPPDKGIVIGLADLIFPSALCVSAYVFTSPATALLCAACSHVGLGLMLRSMDDEGMPAIPYGSLGIAGYLVGVSLGI